MPHRFRQKPSSRRQARPTASWLVLGPSEARLVVHGQRTTHLTPVKPSHHVKRFLPQQRLSVKSFVGGPTECHVVVSGAERIQLGAVDYGLVRELGYARLDAFQEAWVAEHDPGEYAESCILERFQARHAHRWVWVVRFAVDRMLRDRFLAQNSEDGYTESAARGLKDEPPALHDHEWVEHVGKNLDMTPQDWLALGRERKRRPNKHRRMAA